MRSSANPTKGGVYQCAMCRLPVTQTDDNDIGYCDTHWRVVHPQRIRRLIGSMQRDTARLAHRTRAEGPSRKQLQVK